MLSGNSDQLNKNLDPVFLQTFYSVWDKLTPKIKSFVIFLIILILIIVFYSPVIFGDKTIQSVDAIQNKALREYVTKEKEGFTLWNPHLYCGVPAYITGVAPRIFDLSAYLYSTTTRVYAAFFSDYNGIYTFSFLFMAVSALFLMQSLGAGRGVGLFVALTIIFSSGIVSLFFNGHVTKLACLSFLPILFLFLIKLSKRIDILSFLFFALGVHLFIQTNHTQIIYYSVLTVLIYLLFEMLSGIFKKDIESIKNTCKLSIIITSASFLAILMSYDTYSQLWDYKKFSTRDYESGNLFQNNISKEQDLYNYNTNWSFSPEEMLTFLIPSYYGFGASLIPDPENPAYTEEVNTYFGKMEFVQMPMYMGIIVLFLAAAAVFLRWREPFIQFSIIVVVFFILVSFGRNLPVVYRLLYDFLPYFKSFRVPSMILNIVQIFIPVLAGLGLISLIDQTQKQKFPLKKYIKYLVLTTIVLLLLAINTNYLESSFLDRLNKFVSDGTPKGEMLLSLSGYAAGMFKSDVLVALFMLLILFIALWLLSNKQISGKTFIFLIIILAVADLIRISHRGSVYIEKEEIDNLFYSQQQVMTIKNQNDNEPFRIVDIRQNELGNIDNNGGFYAYYLLEDIAGYSAVKPKYYDDIIKKVGLGNTLLWNMTNVKYVVSDFPIVDKDFTELLKSERVYVYKNHKVLPRAFFVDTLLRLSDQDFFQKLVNGKFNPATQAVIADSHLNIDKPDLTASVVIKNYYDENLILKVNATGNNYIVVSSNFMPQGWKAYVNGAETKIYRTNHSFMGILVPQGLHEVKFVYSPDNFYLGKNLSLFTNLAILSLILFFLLKKRNKQNVVEEQGI